MPRTLFIDTTSLPREAMPGGGQYAAILNDALAGARHVAAALRWIEPGAPFEVAAGPHHQLVYIMEGAGAIELDGRTHEVSAGAGVYLEPSERASIRAGAAGTLRLFHLVVPPAPGAPER